LTKNDFNETSLIERIVRLEEAVAYNKDLIVDMSEKLDKFINDMYSNRVDSVSQYGDLNVRVSKLEERLDTRSKDNYMWYTKLTLFVAVVSTIMSYIMSYISKLAGR